MPRAFPLPVIAALAATIVVLLALLVWLWSGDDSRIQTPSQLQGAPDGAVPWTGTRANQDGDSFHFAVVSDRTGGHRAGVFPTAMRKLNLLQPAFVVSVGDLIEGYTENLEVLENEWREIRDFVGLLQMPFFYVPGNHDMSNAVMAELWQQKFGPSYYHFRYRDVLFVALNSELFGMVHNPRQPLPGPWKLESQLGWLEQVLADHADARWTFVFVHQPLWDSPSVHPEWTNVEALLAGRPHTVFAGHQHQYTLHRRNDAEYITLATTGGGSALRGARQGEFDQVVMVHVGAEGPSIANLELQGILDTAVRTEAGRALLRAMEVAVEMVPGVQEREFFSRGPASFRLVNRSETPMQVQASFRAPDGYQAEVEELNLSIDAGASEEVRVPLTATGSLPNIGSMPPLLANFALAADSPDDGEPLRLELLRRWAPEHEFPVRRATRPVQVDAQTDDWQSLRFDVSDAVFVSNPDRHGGDADLSFRFDLQRDDEFLYLLAQIRDDSRVVSTERVARQQDSLTLVLDSRPEPELSRNFSSLGHAAASGALAQLKLSFLTLVETPDDPQLPLYGIQPVPGLRKEVQMLPDGYRIELAIPLQTLSGEDGAAPPERIRLNLIATDFDEGEQVPVQVAWRTPRYLSGSIPGSGVFRLLP